MSKKTPSRKPSKPKSRSKSPKLRAVKGGAGIGHNGKINKALVTIFADYAAIEADKKQMAKAQRDLRAKAKEEHGVQSDVFSHEIRLRKMDSDRRVMFEQGHSDLKDTLGYQMALKLDTEAKEEGSDSDGGKTPDPEAIAAEETRLAAVH